MEIKFPSEELEMFGLVTVLCSIKMG